jgi:flagella basal body P-ring formation protein FlgA
MTMLLSLGAFLFAGETLVLRKDARVAGRWVRLSDLLEAGKTTEAARLQAGGVYLGRAPEEGRSRTITAAEVSRELERRGIDSSAYAVVGEQVVVTLDPEGGASDALLRAVAFEIKRHLLEKDASLRADELAVRVSHLEAEAPAGSEVVEVRPRGEDFVAVLQAPGGGRIEAGVIARVLRTREAAFAVREIPAGKAIERADVEMKTLEVSGLESGYVHDLASLLGTPAAVRIRRGQALSAGDLKLRPVVRKGDVVRAVSATFEVDARALEDGAAGQEIALEFVASRNRARGKVADSGRVEVVK